jgi:hypothetical protein
LAGETYLQILNYKKIYKRLPVLLDGYVKREILDSKDIDEIIRNTTLVKTDESLVNVTILDTLSTNKTQRDIVKTINNYLINNRGAAIDFHIIKEIVDRNTDSVEEAIETKIPSPLYVGLAATMIGIIIGLFSIDFSTTEISAIKPLIEAVWLAMTASVLGLFLTTVLSIAIYKRAKSSVDYSRNLFISFIQTDLLPSIIGPGQSGMASLSHKLDEFGRTTSRSVENLSTIVLSSESQVQSSQELLKKIEQLDLTNVVGANAQLFDKLKGMMDSFTKFPEYYNELNNSLGQTSTLVNNLTIFIDQTQNLNIILEEVKSLINKGNNANEFFNTQIKAFSEYGDAVNRAVLNSDEKMQEAISNMGEASNKLFEGFQKSMLTYDVQLKEAFIESIKQFDNLALKQIEKINEAFDSARPKFEHLNSLPDIKDGIEKYNSEYAVEMISYQKKIDERLGELSNQFSEFQQTDLSRSNSVIAVSSSKSNKSKSPKFDLSLKIAALLASLTIVAYGSVSLANYIISLF